MKAALALLAAAPLMLAAQPSTPAEPLEFEMPSYAEPARPWTSMEDAKPSPEECHDKIRQVREERGQPALRRDTADPDEPLFIAAVDHRIEGCSVMVMRRDTSDVRPLPAPAAKPAELIPAR